MSGKTAYLGHSTTGQLMGFDEWDDMGAEMERRLSFAQQLDEPTSIDRINIWANSGQTTLLAGQGVRPDHRTAAVGRRREYLGRVGR
jgi:hypothetical protein